MAGNQYMDRCVLAAHHHVAGRCWTPQNIRCSLSETLVQQRGRMPRAPVCSQEVSWHPGMLRGGTGGTPSPCQGKKKPSKATCLEPLSLRAPGPVGREEAALV